MTERIRITPSEFKAVDANNNITFSTNNKYIKTGAAGQFKAGGYSRAPFIAGLINYNTDKKGAGGLHYRVSNISATSTRTIPIPFHNGSVYFNLAVGYSNAYLASGSPPASQTYAWYYPGHPYKINGVYAGTCTLYMSVGYYTGYVKPVLPFNFNTNTAGVYDFGTVPTGTWYQYWGTVGNVTINSADLAYIGWGGIDIFYTQPPVNLELAITP